MFIRTTRKTYAIATFLILLVCYSYFIPRPDWTANSRMDLIYAVADQGVLHIDTYHENTGDKALYNEHYYTTKGIGPSLLGLPFYQIYKAILSIPPIHNFIAERAGASNEAELRQSDGYHTAASTFVTFFNTAIPSAILGVIIFWFALRFTQKPFHAFILAVAYGLGTIAFYYSSNMFQHQLAAFGAFVGFFLLWRVIYENANKNWLWLVGLLFSLSAITEYPSVLIMGIAFVWALVKMPDRIALYRVVLGALPLAFIFAGYNYAIFGTPLPEGYSYSVYFKDNFHAAGLMSLTYPRPDRLYGLTFSTFRGMFFISPFLLLMFPGLYWMWKRRPEQRTLIIAFCTMITGYFMYNASSEMWWAGASIGPRYLTPVIPFMILPIIFVFDRWLKSSSRTLSVVVGLLIAASLFNVWAQSNAGQWIAEPVQGTPPPASAGKAEYVRWHLEQSQQGNYLFNPLVDYAIPKLIIGHVRRNFGMALGLSGLSSLLPLLLALTVLSILMFFVIPSWLRRYEAVKNGVRNELKHNQIQDALFNFLQ